MNAIETKSLIYRYRQFIVILVGMAWFALFGKYITGIINKLIFLSLFIVLVLSIRYIKKGEKIKEYIQVVKIKDIQVVKIKDIQVVKKNEIIDNDKKIMNNKYHIIAIASGKGGVGKTTIAANLGATLSKLHKKITIIDMDLAMPNLEIITGLKSPPVGLIDVLEGRLEIEHVTYTGPMGTKIIPPGIMLDGYSKEASREKIIKLFKNFPIKNDYIILDMPPGREAVDVLYKDIEVLLVINSDKASILDAVNMKALLERKGINILGAILNRSEYDLELIDEIERVLETKVVSIIPDSKIVKDASNNEECFAVTKEESVPSKELMELANEIIKTDIGN